MLRGYKIRIYPTKEQEALIKKHIDACRFIWNYMLEIQQQRHENNERYLSRFDMIKLLTKLKSMEEYSWLYEISNASLQRTCTNLSDAYKRLFNHLSNFPQFKSKRNSKSIYPIRSDSMCFKNGKVHIEKLGKVAYKTDYELPTGKKNICKNANVSYCGGKYYIGFALECDNQTVELTDKLMGIDLGIKELATVSFGEDKIVYHNINKSKKMRAIEEKIVYHQKIASRKRRENKGKEKSKNLIKEEMIIKKLSERKANIRKNYYHQITHELVSMRPARVVMETLQFEDMLGFSKEHNKNVAEQSFYEFERLMKYKCEKNGIPFILADKYFKSSKTCSSCGYVKEDLTLSDRVFICPCCGLKIDRDYNAAINLMEYKVQQ